MIDLKLKFVIFYLLHLNSIRYCFLITAKEDNKHKF